MRKATLLFIVSIILLGVVMACRTHYYEGGYSGPPPEGPDVEYLGTIVDIEIQDVRSYSDYSIYIFTTDKGHVVQWKSNGCKDLWGRPRIGSELYDTGLTYIIREESDVDI